MLSESTQERQSNEWTGYRTLPLLVLAALRDDAAMLLRTKTAYGAMILCGWIALAAMVPPVDQNTAEQSLPITLKAEAPVSVTPRPIEAPLDSQAIYIELPGINRKLVAVEPQQRTKRPLNERGVFLTPTSIGSEKFRTYTLDNLRNVGGNMIIFDTKGSAVHFETTNTPMAAELGLVQPKYNAQEVVDILHAQGIYAIARYIAVKDHSLAAALPKTQLEHPKYGHTISEGWIDPADPQVLEYNRQIICELAASGVDEINLDYIRYDTQDGELLAFTGDEKIAKIEAFVRMAREAIDACGPKTKLGLSTFAILGWDYKRNVPHLGQDIVRFAPMLDVISPMSYNANFSLDKWGDPSANPRPRWNYLVYRTVLGYRELLGPDHAWKVRPWIQAWGVDTQEVLQQIQGAFDAGACGFIAWNADNGYAPFYQALKKIQIPEACKGLVLPEESII